MNQNDFFSVTAQVTHDFNLRALASELPTDDQFLVCLGITTPKMKDLRTQYPGLNSTAIYEGLIAWRKTNLSEFITEELKQLQKKLISAFETIKRNDLKRFCKPFKFNYSESRSSIHETSI